jgi:hypothetical protein
VAVLNFNESQAVGVLGEAVLAGAATHGNIMQTHLSTT